MSTPFRPALSLVTLGVEDVARARAFYEALGLTAGPGSQEGVAFFQLSGVVLAVFGRTALAEDAGVPAEGSGFRGVSLAQNVASPEAVDAALAHAVGAGATLVKAGERTFWGGYAGYFADPDGHLWEVAHNPFWVLHDDGRVDLA